MAFEAILLQQRARPSVWRRVTFVVSVALHVALLTAGVVHSLWQVDELPMPAVEVTLAVAAPPPPPPPPPKRSASKKPKTNPTPKSQALVAPKEVSKEIPEPEPEEADDDDGVEGGIEGGVAGGVVGAPAPPPPKPTGPAMLSMKAGHTLLKINPQVAPYKARIPDQYMREGEELVIQLQVCVAKDGRVRDARITRPSIPPVDAAVLRAVPTWSYKPYLVNGQPTEWCYPLVYRIKS
jgi:periplasmic protein TonB